MKFKEGKIIEKFFVEKGGKKIEIAIRYPKRSDLHQVWKFYNKVIKETNFLSRITPVSLNDERKWLDDTLAKCRKNKTIQILAESGGKVIGSCSVATDSNESSGHVGHYGICVLHEYTGLGLGKKLTTHVIRLSKAELRAEILELSVYNKNKIAQNLYRKMGFRKAGKIPRGIKHRNGYMDNIFMYKVLR